jgi:hypothetical protein
MKTLILSDVHHRWKIVDKILSSNSYDKIISLGDWFDQFHDKPKDAEETAVYLKHLLEQDNFTIVHSNHDVCYYQPGFNYLRCPGFSEEKCKVINKHITPDHWAKFKIGVVEQGFVLSHAGFVDRNLPCFPDLEILDENYILRACEGASEALKQHKDHPLLKLGTRMGESGHGGCLWLALQDFRPIANISQIFAHTPHAEIRAGIYPNINSRNYCVDTNNRHLMFIKDGKFFSSSL